MTTHMYTNHDSFVLDLKALLYHEKNCGDSEELCYVKRNPNEPEINVLYFPYCSLYKAIGIGREREKKILEADMFINMEDLYNCRGEPLCDTFKVEELIGEGNGCTFVLPAMDGETRTKTDEGYDLEVDLTTNVGKGKECEIHEVLRQTSTAVLAICAILPENVDGIDELNTFYKLAAKEYTRIFNAQITQNQISYVTWMTGKFDKFSLHIGVACEIFGWLGIRPKDNRYYKLFTRALAWGTIYDYFGGKDDAYSPKLRKSAVLLTTRGRPTSMMYNSLGSILIRAECNDAKKFRCHIDDKFLARSHQTATYGIVDCLWPELDTEILNFCGISMALFTDAIDVIHDYHKCPSSNGLLPFVIRGYCIRSVLLSSYRRTLQVLPEEYKQKFRDSIKGTMYACVTSGRHYVLEQTAGCHCDDKNRTCRKWKAKNCKYFVDDDDGEDYMDLFPSNLIEPTFADRDRLIANIYTYLDGKMDFENLYVDEDLEAKVGWAWSRLQHTCMIHKCPHSEGKDKRR